MKNQTIEQVVEEVCDFDLEVKLWTDKGFNEFKKVLTQALQAQRDAGAREAIEQVKAHTIPYQELMTNTDGNKNMAVCTSFLAKALTPTN